MKYLIGKYQLTLGLGMDFSKDKFVHLPILYFAFWRNEFMIIFIGLRFSIAKIK